MDFLRAWAWKREGTFTFIPSSSCMRSHHATISGRPLKDRFHKPYYYPLEEENEEQQHQENKRPQKKQKVEKQALAPAVEAPSKQLVVHQASGNATTVWDSVRSSIHISSLSFSPLSSFPISHVSSFHYVSFSLILSLLFLRALS